MLRDTFEKVAQTWEPEKVIDGLILDELAQPETTTWERGKTELENFFPLAIRSVGQLAMFATSERTRLNAAKFIIGANISLRKVQAQEDEGPLAKMLQKFEEEANKLREEATEEPGL
jgi:hypothetical protein